MAYKIAFSRMKLDHKIERGDEDTWRRLASSYYNADYALFEIADEIYRGYSFTTWHKDNWRTAKNFILGQHIALDFDHEDRYSTIDFLKNDDFISKYGALIYTTMSHTPEKPRCRVLFLLDKPIYQATNYTNAVMALLWLFSGLTQPDRNCKDPCRNFFGSTNCEMEWLDNQLPIDLIKHLIEQYQASGNEQRKRVLVDYKPSTASEEEVASALHVIPAMGIEYEEWFGILAGIHHHLGDAGLPIAEQWAQGFDGEIPYLWKRFRREGSNGQPITIKYLFKKAGQRGWKWDRKEM